MGAAAGGLSELERIPADQSHTLSPGGQTLIERPSVREEDFLWASHRMLEEARNLLVEARRALEAPGGAQAGRPTPAGRTRLAPSRARMRATTIVTALPAAAGLVLLGVAVPELHGRATQRPDRPDQSRVATAVRERTAPPVPPQATPASRPPTPLWVSVPELGTTAKVTTPVGVQPAGPEKGLLNAPPNYHDLGWFRRTDGSLLVIDGHVGYRQDPGPLAFIGRLSVGDLIVVGTENGTEIFRVGTVGRSVKGQLPASYFTAAYGRDLMLITCDYTSPFSAGHFADNVYVVADPAG